MRAVKSSARPRLGETGGDRPVDSLDDLRVRAPRPVEGLPWLVWALITAALAYGALVLLSVMYTAMLDRCDELHESPDTAFSGAVAAASIFVSLVVGHRVLARRLLLVAYAAGVLQAFIWYWLLGDC